MADKKDETVGVEDVAAEFAVLKSDIARLTEAVRALLEGQAETAGESVRAQAAAARAKAGAVADDVLARGEATARQACSRAGEIAGEVNTHVARNPVLWVAGAIGLGFLIGLASRR
ncbi:hypothetical protein [Pseudoxanthobacter sp.]|uniref:hypothetical protein n=1 Tax=Pseudoxanthobacter sp. TaxID=1925742 RepID=UPI002FE03CD3